MYVKGRAVFYTQPLINYFLLYLISIHVDNYTEQIESPKTIEIFFHHMEKYFDSGTI